jgi:nitrogen regulatory protein PII
MPKMVMIIYNEALDSDIAAALEKCALKNYTKITGTFGRGTTSGTHLGNDIWPGRNNILYLACEEKQTGQVLSCIRELRKRVGHEGLKAFVLPIEEIT